VWPCVILSHERSADMHVKRQKKINTRHKRMEVKEQIKTTQRQTGGEFHKSWARGAKLRAHPKSNRKCKNLSTRRKCMISN
jgi:hypothetical protein